MQLLRSRDNPLLLPGLTPVQRLCHLASMITYLEAYQKLAYLLAPPITLMAGVLPVRVGAVEFMLHWLPYFGLGILANRALGRGSFRYVQTEQYNLLKMFTFIWASTIVVWPRPLRFRVTPKQAGSTPYALERRQLLPHAALLGLIVAGVVLGVMNLVWGVTTHFADAPVVVATLAWAIASGGLVTFTVQQVLGRLHGRHLYRFTTSVPAELVGPDESLNHVAMEDLSMQGCSLVAPAFAAPWTNVSLTLQLSDGPLSIASQVVHDRALPDGRRRLGLRFRVLSPADRERLIEFLFVILARHQTERLKLPEPVEVEVRRELAA